MTQVTRFEKTMEAINRKEYELYRVIDSASDQISSAKNLRLKRKAQKKLAAAQAAVDDFYRVVKEPLGRAVVRFVIRQNYAGFPVPFDVYYDGNGEDHYGIDGYYDKVVVNLPNGGEFNVLVPSLSKEEKDGIRGILGFRREPSQTLVFRVYKGNVVEKLESALYDFFAGHISPAYIVTEIKGRGKVKACSILEFRVEGKRITQDGMIDLLWDVNEKYGDGEDAVECLWNVCVPALWLPDAPEAVEWET